MNKQKGIIALGWLILAGILLVITSLAGLIKLWSNYTTNLDKQSYDRGKSVCNAEYIERDNTQLQIVMTAKIAAEKRVNEVEAKLLDQQIIIKSNYIKGIKDGKKLSDDRITAINIGTSVLYDPGIKTRDCPTINNESASSKDTTTTTGNIGTSGTELSAEASRFLLNLTEEADRITRRLILAQSVILSNLKVCNSE